MLHPEAPAVIRAFLALHIAAGTLALIVVPVVLAVSRGGAIHRRLGLLYVYAMFVVAVSALIVAPYFRDYFLLLVAIFSSYLTFLGWRAIARKHPEREPARAPDWAGALLAVGTGGGMLAIGFKQWNGFSIVLAVLGAICLAKGTQSIYQFYRPPVARAAWLFAHFGNMLAAYIATVTAFSAVNLRFIDPIWLRWMWPTVVGTIFITYYTTHYKLKLKAGAPVSELVTLRETTAITETARESDSVGGPLERLANSPTSR